MSASGEACDVREALDVFHARRCVRQFCSRMGLPRQLELELELVASELCTNILKYGVRGSLHVRQGRDPDRGTFVEIVARDEGPPFHDLASALRDGCDDRGPIDPGALTRRGGLATGLGTIVRLTHSLSVDPGPPPAIAGKCASNPPGKRITVRRYAEGPPGPPRSQ